MTTFPALFVSHGAPNLILHNEPARDFLAKYGAELGRPKAILMVSAHFETDIPVLTADEKPDMIYDFRGFEPELYRFTYPAPGDPVLARKVGETLVAHGLEAALASNRGFDHGAWVPLKLMYPDADIPVVQLSIQTPLGPEHHFRLGRALADLRKDGILIIGSGALTHNLGEFFRGRPAIDAEPQDWVVEFGEWVREKAETGDTESLIHYRERAPHAVRNHPTDDHFLPFFVALGAAGEGAKARRVHASHSYGILQMDAYAFEN